MSKKFITLIAVLLLASLIASPAFAAQASAANDILIGIPDDPTNGGRAIKLLESVGLIEVDPAAGKTPELKDITKYLYNIEIVPAAANTLPATLDDYGAATINSTYALPAGLLPSVDGLSIEVQETENNLYVNIIAARSADKDNETYQTVVAAYQSDLVAQYLLAKYSKAQLPVFDYAPTEYSDEDLLALVDGYKSDKADKTVVTVGVCGTFNDQWKAVQYALDQEEAGIYIELVEFDAYTLPNEALNSGDIDLNAFQHKAYLAKEVEANGYEVEAIGDTLIAPLVLFSKQFDSVDALKDAAGAK